LICGCSSCISSIFITTCSFGLSGAVRLTEAGDEQQVVLVDDGENTIDELLGDKAKNGLLNESPGEG